MPCLQGIQLLLDEVLDAGNDPNHTAYDILRTPIYRGDRQDCADYYNAIMNALTDCTCPNLGPAITLLNTAHALLGENDTSKAAYNAALQAQEIIYVTAVPIPKVPTGFSTYLSTDANPYLYEPGVHDLGDHRFSYVQGNKTMAWRIINPILMPRNRENTFWLSLAYGLKDDFKYWAEVKARTQQYYNNVMVDRTHPRHADYTALNNYTIARSTANAKVGNSTTISTLPVQLRATLPLAHVTPELWQVVADAFKIELLIIVRGSSYYEPGKQDFERNRLYPVIPRGDHNSRQVFICMEDEDFVAPQEYHAIVPVKQDRFQWRYIHHMPNDRQKPPTTPAMVEKDAAKRAESNRRRCPFLISDANGVATNPPTLLPEKAGRPIMPPRAIVDDSASNAVTEEQVLAYWNNGLHNP